MTAISDLYGQHHDTCDDAFSEAEAAGTEGRWDDARASLSCFVKLLEAHLASEEETLFPAFESATGMREGPTAVMRLEHSHMRALVERLGRALDAKDAAEFSSAAETLLILMQQHNMKEERMLYPMCDQALKGDSSLMEKARAQLGA